MTCKSEEQRNNIRGCTSLGDTSVVASLPFSEERRRREAVAKLNRVAIGGAPVDMAEEEIKDETGAALVKRIQKRDQSKMLIPTMTVMLAYNHEDEVSDKVNLRWLKFKTRPYIQLVTRCFQSQATAT